MFRCSDVYGQKRHSRDAISEQAQTVHNAVWRKRVVRTVCLPATIDSNHRLSASQSWYYLFQKVIKDGINGSIKCYRDASLCEQLSPDAIEVPECNLRDTEVVVDPLTGEEKIQFRKNDLDRHPYTGVCSRFRIGEEWTYDLSTAKTTIRIVGFAPAKNIYGDADYRSTLDQLWIKWGAFVKYLDDTAIAEELGNLIWQDYFRDSGILKDSVNADNDRGHNKAMNRIVVRKIKMEIDTFTNNQEPNLINQYDTSILWLLYDAAYNGRIKALMGSINPRLPDTNNHDSLLSNEDLKLIIYGIPDTIITVDDGPPDGRVIVIRDFCFECHQNYYIKEEWKFDLFKGLTEINSCFIAPEEQIIIDGRLLDEVPLFWVTYPDARRVLANYNEYNPRYNIEWQVWANRFNEPNRKRPMQE